MSMTNLDYTTTPLFFFIYLEGGLDSILHNIKKL